MNAALMLRRARQQAGLSLRDLASLAGTSHSTLSAYENGTKTPTIPTLTRILHAAGFVLETTLRPRQRGADDVDRGEELAAVLLLAEEFPARHEAELQAPVFRRFP